MYPTTSPRSQLKWTVKLGEDTAIEMRETVREILSEEFPWFSGSDPLVVEQRIRHLRVFYVCVQASRESSGSTFIECRIRFHSTQMWIGGLQVAASYRRQGLGRQLVRALEEVARVLDVRAVKLYPLPSSQRFWQRLGYRPDAPRAWLLSKNVGGQRSLFCEMGVDDIPLLAPCTAKL